MSLSEKNKNYLINLGIVFHRETPDHAFIYKKTGVGKTMPNFRPIALAGINADGDFVQIYPTDCPTMTITYTATGFTLTCWDWVPGPGPGDFEKPFTSEGEMVAFIESYYFGDNGYFEARKKHHENQA